MINPINFDLPKVNIILNQTADSGIFFEFENRQIPQVQNKLVYFQYNNNLYFGKYGFILETSGMKCFIKEINNFETLEPQIINTPGIILTLFDTFDNEFSDAIINLFQQYSLFYNEYLPMFDFIRNFDNDYLMKCENLEVDSYELEVMRFSIDFTKNNPMQDYKFMFYDEENSVLSGYFKIHNTEDVTLIIERNDFSGEEKIKFKFYHIEKVGENLISFRIYRPLSGENKKSFNAYIAVPTIECLTSPLDGYEQASNVTINKQTDYELVVLKNSGMKPIVRKDVIATQFDADNSKIFIDNVALPSSCTIVIKNGKTLYPSEYTVNGNFIENITLAENDTITAIYSFVLNRKDITISETNEEIIVENEAIILVVKNGKCLYPDEEYSINGNSITIETVENDTITILYY